MAYSYFNTRRKLEVGLLLLLILFGFAAIGSEWIGWVSLTSSNEDQERWRRRRVAG
jgi:hypothetical protein